MNEYILFSGSVVMLVIGVAIGDDLNAQCAVALGLMWMGIAVVCK